jgi:hypothetical protein
MTQVSQKRPFPKLKWPLDTRGLDPRDRSILIAYDNIWRWLNTASLRDVPTIEGLTLLRDTEATLGGLGAFIEANLGADRFQDQTDLNADGTVFGIHLDAGD